MVSFPSLSFAIRKWLNFREALCFSNRTPNLDMPVSAVPEI